jgi:phage terminase large subunit-like protein
VAIDLDQLTEDEKRELIELWNLSEKKRQRNWLAGYRPYKKQVAFHNAGKNFRERCFMAANQSGKTLSAAAEIAIHATGLYPDWWDGWRFNRPTVGIVGSESFDLNKRGLQRLLLGRADQKEDWGTGTIPYDNLVRYTMVQGVQDAVASITVRHTPSGENSVIQLASYEQGRMQRADSPVLTPTGWRAIGALKVGDRVIAGDGSVTTVEGVFPHGVKDLYELTFDSGVKTICGAEHLWTASNRTTGPWRVMDTAALIKRYGDAGERPPSNDLIAMPHVGVVQFPYQRPPVDPYLVGALLGDGCVRGGRVRFTSADSEIVEQVRRAAAELGAGLSQWYDIQYGFTNSGRLRAELTRLGMDGKLAHEKEIPESYLWNAPDVRFAVLQGLMDTDGTVSKKGSLGFASTSPKLAEGVAFLVRSFGGKAKLRRREGPDRKRPIYIVALGLPEAAPFRLTRKAQRCVRPETETHRHILRSIRKIAPAEAVCIAVAHPSELYVTDDFVVTHNTKWQADSVDYVFLDEEPPQDIYFEAMTRTNVSGGPIAMTFTPLLGASSVVRLFLPVSGERAPSRDLINMTIDDAEHYTPEERAAIIAQYPEHEREARAFGRPVLGSGMVFPVAESAIRIEPFAIPDYWGRILGVDFGYDHPTAGAWCAYDTDTDTMYVYKTYRKSRTIISEHAASLRSPAPWIPVAWPHDGLQHDKQAGRSIKDLYREAGLNMLPRHATFTDHDISSFSFEAGISEMLDRMQTGRLKVFSTCTEFFEEMRSYHRKDGKVVKVLDDVISAIRYAMMMRRHARSKRELAPQKTDLGVPLVSFGVLDPETGY